MTGQKIYDSALKLLGYERTSQIDSSALAIVNMIYGDLYYKEHTEDFEPLETLANDIELISERLINDVMLYGIASGIAAGQYDTDKQQYYSNLYNKKRIKSCTSTEIADTMPTPL